jgi:hypothetical protein
MEWLPSLQILGLDQNNITASLDLASININGPLHVVNLIGNNIGPNITLYYNMSHLVSNGVSIMLEDNPCCVNVELNDAELYYFCNITNHPPSAVNDRVIKITVPVAIVIFLVAMISFFLYWSTRKDKYTLLLQIQQGKGINHVSFELTLFLKFHILQLQINLKIFMNWRSILMNQIK